MNREQIAEEIKIGLAALGEEQTEDKAMRYVEWLDEVGTLDEPRCIIYAGLWCTFSQLLVTNFLIKQESRGKNLRSLREIYEIFSQDFADEILLDHKQEEFAKRARICLDYVGDLDLTKYGVSEYDKAEEWI